MNKHYHSVFYNETDLLKAVLELHIKKETFDCNPMFYKGAFYKNIPIPKIIGDIRGELLNIPILDATNLINIANNSLDNIILDPPFVIANRPTQLKSNTTNFSYFTTEKTLLDFYFKILSEAYRILKPKGICVFKCQNFTDNKTLISHYKVFNWSELNGFYVKDLAILVNSKNKPTNNKLNQKHFRKIHTYFWILEKKKVKNVI